MYYRKVIKITALDSPNVKVWLAQRAAGMEPNNAVIIPGILTGAEYEARRDPSFWDAQRQCEGLDADWYEGPELRLFPIIWLNHAEELFRQRGAARKARAIGVDPAEGGDKTAMAAVDEWGLIEMVSRKTPDTNVIAREVLMFARKHGVASENVCFDRGGGGKQHADKLRAMGHMVRTVAFGESLVLEPQRQKRQFIDKKEGLEQRYVYVNRRAQMYWELSQAMDPANQRKPEDGLGYNRGARRAGGMSGFAIASDCCDWVCPQHGRQCLKEQLKAMPKLYDDEGRCRMLAKSAGRMESMEGGKTKRSEPTLIQLIGHSPDESDALVLAYHGLIHKAKRAMAGAAM